MNAIPVGNGWNKATGIGYAIELDTKPVLLQRGDGSLVVSLPTATMPILRVRLERRINSIVSARLTTDIGTN